MGAEPAVLLVKAQRWLALCLVLVAAPAAAQDIVRAGDYDAFWLWAGVREHSQVANARTLYLLAGEVGAGRDGVVRLKAQGAAEPGPHGATLWLVYRVRSLDWPPEIAAEIARRLAAWRAQSGVVAGVQIDFDASTHGLVGYADFLRALRQLLPADCALGVTGLMDWAAQGNLGDLDALAGNVDEIIFQTYRGANTVTGIDAYVARLGRLTIPFRLGLAEGAAWSAPPSVAENPLFRGYVVFLRNGAARQP